MKISSPTTLSNIPPVRWKALAENPRRASAAEVAEIARSLAVGFTRMAVYFNARHYGRSHDRAVKEASRAVTIVRKALGYSYPKDTLSF